MKPWLRVEVDGPFTRAYVCTSTGLRLPAFYAVVDGKPVAQARPPAEMATARPVSVWAEVDGERTASKMVLLT